MAEEFEFEQNTDHVVKILTREALGKDNFSVELRSNINDPESFNRWLKSFSEQSKTNWIVRSSVSSERSSFAFSKDFVCHHSSANKSSKKDPVLQKNKNCPATLKVRIKRNTKKTRSTDPYVKEGLLCSIRIRFEHSHNLDAAEAWGWLKRKDDTRKAFIEYFNKGFCPSEAIHFHEDLLLADRPESLADASINPPKKWVYYLHDIWRKNEFESAKEDDDLSQASKPSKRSKTSNTENPVIVRYGSQEDTPIKVEAPDPDAPETSSPPPPKVPAIQYFVLKPDCIKTPLDLPMGRQPPPEDEIDSFLRLMGQTIKKFSPRFQIEAKKKIFDVITEIELRNCMETSGTASSNASS